MFFLHELDRYRHTLAKDFDTDEYTAIIIHAQSDLRTRAIAGLIIVPIAYLLGGFATDYASEHWTLYSSLGILLFISLCIRLLLIVNYKQERGVKSTYWQPVFFLSNLTVGFVVGSFVTSGVLFYHDSPSITLFIIILAGISGGSIASYCTWGLLSYTYLLLCLVPVIIAEFYIGSNVTVPVGIAISIFLIFNLMQARNWNESYWTSLINVFLVKKNALEREHINKQLADEIVEHKRTAKNIAISRQKLQDIYNSAHDAIFIFNLDGEVIDVNQTMLKIFETERQYALNFNIGIGLLSTSNKGIDLKTFWQETLLGHDQEFEWLTRRQKSKEQFFVQVNMRKTLWGDDQVVIATVRDINDKKVAEKREQEALQSLSETEGYLHSILENANLPIYCKDSSFNYILANKEFKRLAGLKGQDLQSISDYDIFPESLADDFRDQDAKVLEKNIPLEFQTTILLQDGVHVFTTAKFPLLDRESKLYGVGGICTDITPLMEAMQDAQDANLAKSEFLANISHELRTPMHGILGYARLGEKRAESVSRSKLNEYFAVITESGSRLMGLLNDLLDFSKLEVGKMHYAMSTTDLLPRVHQVITELTPLAAEKEISFKVKSEDEQLTAFCDQEKIVQVLRNLLSNAIKFSYSDNTITLSCTQIFDTQEMPLQQISVHNRGIPIPDEELTSIFDKFTQSSATKTGAGGTGLGLAICKQIVTDHRGSIWAENSGDGTTIFRFLLPADVEGYDKRGEVRVS